MFEFASSPPDASLIYVGTYNSIWVVISILLAILSSYAALKASQRIEHQQESLSRLSWAVISAITLGVGIWAMHFIGILALHLPCKVHYDLPITLFSIIPSILASGVALGVVWHHGEKRLSPPVASVLLGAGIGIMHYTGMAGMQLDGVVRYDPYLFALSIIVAIALSYLALRIKNHEPQEDKLHNIRIAFILGGAVSGMHYTAMLAAYFVKGDVSASSHSVFSNSSIAVLVVLVTAFLTLFTLVLATISRNREITKQLLALTIELKELNASLERKVIERTEELSQANREIEASIAYASLIQKAILPTQQLIDFLGDNQSVVWLPRDTIGGDFYIFYPQDEKTYLLGIVDCAGHGIPGALMTMLAYSALDRAISECGINSPATLLEKTDAILRNRLQNVKTVRSGLAVNMDAGLVFIDTEQQSGLFAGAKVSLYSTDGRQVKELKGVNRAILGSKTKCYTDLQLTIKTDTTFCMTTDGILDQAGGSEGFGFGNSRFTDLICQNADQETAQQANMMMNAIHDYRGDYPQRDDITLLFFKPKKREFSHADN